MSNFTFGWPDIWTLVFGFAFGGAWMVAIAPRLRRWLNRRRID
ncbi:MAG: hypothetical protein ACREN7_00330 [Candidatus Dormibacteria bacterium]